MAHEVLYAVTVEEEMAEGPLLMITMKEDFDREGMQSDSYPDEVYDALDEAGFGEVQEGIWEPMEPMSFDEIKAHVSEADANSDSVTFTESPEFKEFLDKIAGG